MDDILGDGHLDDQYCICTCIGARTGVRPLRADEAANEGRGHRHDPSAVPPSH
jgi:hypothetical protein